MAQDMNVTNIKISKIPCLSICLPLLYIIISKSKIYVKQAGAEQCQAQGLASFELLVHLAKPQRNILFV